MTEELHERIAYRAYELWEERGRSHADDWRDWFDAERELLRPWRVEAHGTSVTEDVATATLVLRLGIAVNAARSAQRFYYFVKDAAGPGGQRDRLWAFLIAVGFLHEAIQTVLRPNFPAVSALAKAGGASDALIKSAGALLSGKAPLSRILDRMRNKLIFHWDDAPIREFVHGFAKPTAVWAEGLGDTQGEMLYGIAADALTNSVLPDDGAAAKPEPPEESLERLRKLMNEIIPASRGVLELFDCAIKGHLKAVGAVGEYL